jgi:hypothetical protein
VKLLQSLVAPNVGVVYNGEDLGPLQRRPSDMRGVYVMSSINTPADFSADRLAARQAVQAMKLNQAGGATHAAAAAASNATDSAQVSDDKKKTDDEVAASASKYAEMARAMNAGGAPADAGALADSKASYDKNVAGLQSKQAEADAIKAQISKATGIDVSQLGEGSEEPTIGATGAPSAAAQVPAFDAAGAGSQLLGDDSSATADGTDPSAAAGTPSGAPTPVAGQDPRLVVAQKQLQLHEMWNQLNHIYSQINADDRKTALDIFNMQQAQGIAEFTACQTEIFNKQAAVHAGVAAFIKNYISA